MITIPLQIRTGSIVRNDDVKHSIDDSINMLLNTAPGSVAADPNYGFVFTSLRFENFDENNGTVFGDSEEDPIYDKKVSGTSRNIITFAAELDTAIKKYEKRLTDTSTTMTYLRESRQIIVAVRATIAQTGKPYQFSTIINVWSKH